MRFNASNQIDQLLHEFVVVFPGAGQQNAAMIAVTTESGCTTRWSWTGCPTLQGEHVQGIGTSFLFFVRNVEEKDWVQHHILIVK